MCRKNQMLGGLLIAFGLGLLIGKCLETGLTTTFISVIIVFCGAAVCRQK